MPPPRFTTGELKAGDVDFCYGSRDGQLWIILDRIFDLGLKFETTDEAVEQRKEFLITRGIGVCDMVASARREAMRATDRGIKQPELRDLISVLKKHPKVDTLLFTGGNSKNGPEYFFRRHLKTYNLRLTCVSDEVPRIHRFQLPDSSRTIETVSLTAPSGSANRAVGAMDVYKNIKAENPDFNTVDFRVKQYKPFF